ncbi:acyltransferase [Butyrivibrio fibrisolvens]|uniref:acyltransferase n=1 Tax=Butyrivibrio fibrisolvens TaxID=831 RepID=UPI0003B3CAD7|nr:acyltransferase [Butyrivibrio fibrisolvens]
MDFRGKNVTIKDGCQIGSNVVLEDNVYIDFNCIIRDNVTIKSGTTIGANCIIGEYTADWFSDHNSEIKPLVIGKDSIIRSGSIIYSYNVIGNNFQTGHHVTIREKTKIGNNVSVGTLSDVQGNCTIGDYVRIHSNVHIGQLSRIDSFTWIYPYVVLTNDPTPPSDNFVGVHIKPFAVVATGSLIMPGIEIGQDSLVAAGAIVTKNVDDYAVVAGNPGKKISDVRKIKSHFADVNVYPWREHFETYMPWIGQDFKTWYSNLDLESKIALGIDKLTV